MMMVKIGLAASLFICAQGYAGQDAADQAVTEILFDEEMENVAYVVDGTHLDIQFGIAVPEAQMASIIERLQSHAAISSVLAGRGTANFCEVP